MFRHLLYIYNSLDIYKANFHKIIRDIIQQHAQINKLSIHSVLSYIQSLQSTENPNSYRCDQLYRCLGNLLQLRHYPFGDETVLQKEERKSSVDKITPKVIQLISTTISDLADDDGWAFLGDVGSLLQKKQPNFDSRNFGFQKLTPLIFTHLLNLTKLTVKIFLTLFMELSGLVQA